MSWQARLYARFRAAPDEWLSLGELFETVKFDIPLHYAMRRAVRSGHHQPCSDKSQWLFFTGTLSQIGIERNGHGRYWAYGDRARLCRVAGKTCEKCGGPVVKATWTARTGVVCLYNCHIEKPAAAPVTVAPAMPWPTRFAMQLIRRRNQRNLARIIKKQHCPALSLNEIERQLQRCGPEVLIQRYRSSFAATR